MENIKKRINDELEKNKTVMIGIDGLGGAGKSTISEELYRYYAGKNKHVTVFHIDDFIHPKCIRYNDGFPEWECYYNLQWRYDYFLETIAGPLKKNGSLNDTVEFYNKEEDKYDQKAVRIADGSVVITEGIFLQREELNNAFDFVVYIDVPEEERLNRVLKRDGYIGTADDIKAKYERRYFPAERYYAEKYAPDKSADYVIKG